MKIDSAKPPSSPLKKGHTKKGQAGADVDEMGTIHLIDSLDPESKKVLNSLVQSVLVTQQDNDKNKLELLGQKRVLIQAQRTMMEEKLETEKQKFELQRLAKEKTSKLGNLSQLHVELDHLRSCTPSNLNRTTLSRLEAGDKKKRRKVLSIRRFKVSSDGTRRLISVQSGFRTTKAEPDESCAVEPFYVPVNTRSKGKKDAKNFWDDESGEESKKVELSVNNSLSQTAP